MTKHKLGDSVWSLDSLDFVAIVDIPGNSDSCDMCLGHKRGIHKPIGYVQAVPKKDGNIEHFEQVLRRVALQMEGSEFTVAREVSRVDLGFGKPYLILLSNNVILSRTQNEFKAVHLGPGAEIRVGKGSTALAKHVEVIPSPSAGEESMRFTDVTNDVDLSPLILKARGQAPDLTVTDTSRSALNGWFICFVVPLLVGAGLIGAAVGAVYIRRGKSAGADADEIGDKDAPQQRPVPIGQKRIHCTQCGSALLVRQAATRCRIRCPKCGGYTHVA